MSSNPEDQNAGFASLGLADPILEALVQLGYEEPTPIQREAIPPLLEGRDLLGQAATGTGKTAAFALPLLHRLAGQDRAAGPRALVLVPTRELAMQVAEAVYRYGRGQGVRVLPIYGGQPIGRQIRTLQQGVDVVVATPGRALDHMRRGTLDLEGIQTVVLDEADEMLDMGFAEDLEAILAESPEQRQTVLFSATLPPRIGGIARRHLRDPVNVQIAREAPAAGESPLVQQMAYVVTRAHKLAALGRILDMESPTAAIIFCRTRNEVDELVEALNIRGYRAEALHGGMSQEQRDKVMRRLRGGSAELLIATDVAARGLDVEHLTHVVNYDVPSAPEAYVHRIGRVGRAGREGVAITLAEPREHRQLRNIERVVRQRIPVGQVPTVADLRARRLDLTRAAIREALLEGDSDGYAVVVESLAEEFDPMEIAMAAVKLVHQSAAGGEEDDADDIPAARLPREDAPGARRGGREARGAVQRGGGGSRGGGGRGGRFAVLRVSAGRQAGIRPQDLVGAITNEAGINSRQIGSIEIADRYSLVEVDSAAASEVVNALRAATLRGKKVTVTRERQEG